MISLFVLPCGIVEMLCPQMQHTWRIREQIFIIVLTGGKIHTITFTFFILVPFLVFTTISVPFYIPTVPVFPLLFFVFKIAALENTFRYMYKTCFIWISLIFTSLIIIAKIYFDNANQRHRKRRRILTLHKDSITAMLRHFPPFFSQRVNRYHSPTEMLNINYLKLFTCIKGILILYLVSAIALCSRTMEDLNIARTFLLPQQVVERHQVLHVDVNNRGDLSQPIKEQSDEKKSIHSWDIDTIRVDSSLGLRYLFNGFRFLGIHMPKTHKFLYIIWSIIVNVCVTIYLPAGLLIGFVKGFDAGVEMGDLLTSFQVAIDVVGCSIKLILMGFLLPSLKACHPVVERLDKRCNTAEQRALVHRFVRNGNRFVVLFALAYWSYSTSTCISAVIFRRLPYNMYNPFVDGKKSWGHYTLCVLMEMIPMNFACFQQVVDDSYAVIYVNMIRAHLKALMIRLQRINTLEGRNKDLNENVEELKLFMIDHKNILELYDRVAPVISITIFVQFTITAILLCATLINIMIFATNFAAIVASCFYVLAVVVEVFPLCYYAQCLTDENDLLGAIIFHSCWVNQNKSYRKMLAFFIQRSQKTMALTAGKIFPITLSSFISIAKFSFSLYILIKEMDLKGRYNLN